VHIPNNDAEQLLVTHWNHLGYSTLFIQAALYVGTPKCRELADVRIRECPSDVSVLKFVDDLFGVMEVGRQDQLTLEHFARLLPYADKLETHSVWSIVNFCNQRGYGAWARDHLLPYLSEGHRKTICPTESDVAQTLDECTDDPNRLRALPHWVEMDASRSLQPEKLLAIVERWLKNTARTGSRRVAAVVVASIGSRSDLQILESGPSVRTADENRIIEDTRYRVQRRSPR
jgi:hypothetical protein